MGLAPYGEPRYVNQILDNLLDLKDDGTFRLDIDYFNYATGLTMTGKRLHRLFGGPPRQPESALTQKEMDIARSIQVVTEEIVLRLANTVHREYGSEYLCLAGGVALNCVSNGRVLKEGPFRDIWIQPAAGDAGGALGAALLAWHHYLDKPREINGPDDSMQGAYLGPRYSNKEIIDYLDSVNAPWTQLDDKELMPKLAELLDSEMVIGWFNGRMEFGPRALGARSIIGDPRSQTMQKTMNLKIKYRESFRPFAPAVLADSVSEWFELDRKSPYMLIVAPVAESKYRSMTAEQEKLTGLEKLDIPRSEIPAVTHVDYSARVQTVHAHTNPRFHELISCFEKRTGCSLVINTSFNVRGEPLVASPEDAYRCFMRTEMDYLVMENIILSKLDQPQTEQDDTWKTEFELD
jgi:carbamoyltransferase